MSRMRHLLSLLFLMTALFSKAQDKVYLKDNSLWEGQIIDLKEKNITLRLSDQTKKTISRKEVALIIYSDGKTEAGTSYSMDQKNEDFGNKSWMIGTNILQPLEGMGGIMIEKKITEPYAIRVGQTFLFSRYAGIEASTSVLNNFYIGKKRIKWMNAIGLNLIYTENRYYPYEGPILFAADLIWPYPTDGFHSNFDLGLTIGTGIHIDVTQHLAFTTQLFFNNYFWQQSLETELDFYNTGFSFFYKF